MSNLQTEDWKIEKRGRICDGCERKFDSEEVHYSGIAEVVPAEEEPPAEPAPAEAETPAPGAPAQEAPSPAPVKKEAKKPAPGKKDRKKDEEEEAGPGFERRDYCVPCWEKKPELFSFWKTQMPKIEEKKLEDINAMVEFFRALIETPLEDPHRAKIAYLTALLLARKRRIRLAGSSGGRLRIEKTWDGEATTIPEPLITDEELGELRTGMEQLFEITLGSGDLPEPKKRG